MLDSFADFLIVAIPMFCFGYPFIMSWYWMAGGALFYFTREISADAHAQFVLQKVQPALLGLMDGSVSTLAPLFAAAGATAATGKAILRRPNVVAGFVMTISSARVHHHVEQRGLP